MDRYLRVRLGSLPLRETVGTASGTSRMIVFRLKESIEIRSRPAKIYPSLVVSSDYVLKIFRPSYVTRVSVWTNDYWENSFGVSLLPVTFQCDL